MEVPELRERVDISTVDGFASRVVAEASAAVALRPLKHNEEESRWVKAAKATGFTGSAQFLTQEYRHVVLAQDIRTLAEYEAADRRGRGSRLAAAQRPLVWETVERFTAELARDGDEAQDLHPAQWRLLRAAAPTRPDDLFIAGDPHQRIYDSKVSLKSLGIKVAGRSVKLRKNYRSTQEILRWSTALLERGGIAVPKAITPADLDPEQHETDLMSERCLLFVACTRARDSLYLSWSGRCSLFLVEAGV